MKMTAGMLSIVWVMMMVQPVAAAEVSSPLPSADEPLILSLSDAIRRALAQNIDLEGERRNPEIRQSEVIIEEAKFDSDLRFELNGGRTVRPSASAVDAGFLFAGKVSPIESTTLRYNLGLEQRLMTGTRYQLSWDMTRQGGPLTVFDPNFASSLSMTVTQPLLKGFGSSVNRTELILSQNNLAASLEALQGKAMEIVAKVEESYWDLVFQRRSYQVEQEKRRAAQELLAMNQAKVEQGLIAPVEVLVAEAAVADREEDILSAEKRVRDAEDQLRQAMNLPSPSLVWETPIIPMDEPTVAPSDIHLREAIETALGERRDLRRTRFELQNREQRVRQMSNQTLPALDLKGTAGLAGLGTGYRDDLDRLTSGDFYNWEAGVLFTMPLGNRAARAAFYKEKIEAEKAAMNLKKLEQDVILQLREAVRRVETDQKRISTTAKSRALAEKKLEIETERLRLGLATTQNVLEFQKDLADAHRRELMAITDYNKSLSYLAQVQGTLLRDRGVVITERPGSGIVE